MLTKEQEQVFHDAWAKRFVWPFMEERFAASASHRLTENYELVNQAGSVALRFVDEWWRHPQDELGLRRLG